MLLPEEMKLIKQRTARFEELLHGLEPAVVGAILADLTATWLAGFQGEEIDRVREQLLKFHVKHIRDLIPVNERLVAEREMEERAKDGKLM
jgi:hypothetical protein